MSHVITFYVGERRPLDELIRAEAEGAKLRATGDTWQAILAKLLATSQALESLRKEVSLAFAHFSPFPHLSHPKYRNFQFLGFSLIRHIQIYPIFAHIRHHLFVSQFDEQFVHFSSYGALEGAATRVETMHLNFSELFLVREALARLRAIDASRGGGALAHPALAADAPPQPMAPQLRQMLTPVPPVGLAPATQETQAVATLLGVAAARPRATQVFASGKVSASSEPGLLAQMSPQSSLLQCDEAPPVLNLNSQNRAAACSALPPPSLPPPSMSPPSMPLPSMPLPSSARSGENGAPVAGAPARNVSTAVSSALRPSSRHAAEPTAAPHLELGVCGLHGMPKRRAIGSRLRVFYEEGGALVPYSGTADSYDTARGLRVSLDGFSKREWVTDEDDWEWLQLGSQKIEPQVARMQVARMQVAAMAGEGSALEFSVGGAHLRELLQRLHEVAQKLAKLAQGQHAEPLERSRGSKAAGASKAKAAGELAASGEKRASVSKGGEATKRPRSGCSKATAGKGENAGKNTQGGGTKGSSSGSRKRKLAEAGHASVTNGAKATHVAVPRKRLNTAAAQGPVLAAPAPAKTIGT